jgi:outer membrane protein OmpA-like peptidoglycan-associated protein
VSQPGASQPSLAPPLQRGEQLPGGRIQNGERRVEERDGRTYIRENDNRLIIREGGRDIIRHDEVERLRRGSRNVDVQQRPNGRREIVILQPDGDRIVTIVDADGNMLRRERRARDGRNYVLIENDFERPRGGFYRPVELPPFRLSIPRERYIVEADDSSYDVIQETLRAPPVERVERAYSLDEVRYNQRLREKMSRVDIDTINFAFGSADVDPNGAARLDAIARALNDVVRRNPNEVFLIEGHTDAVGGDTENLTLSDRRAESVAAILTERYQLPPENLVTQGYGEQFLKVQTDAAERQNRRVTVRRITPLLQQGDNQAPAPR